MFKKIILSILIAAALLSSSAQALSTDQLQNAKVNSLEEISNNIESTKTSYLRKNRVSSIYHLPKKELYDLVNKVNAFKKKNHSVYEPYIRRDIQLLGWERWKAGHLLLTLDASSFGINYGHAGMYGVYPGLVLEALPGAGVTARNESSWHNSKCKSKRQEAPGSTYGVVGVSSQQADRAVMWAASQLGKSYGFLPWDSDFYCSELIHRAWRSAGKNIRLNNQPFGLILPVDLMLSPDTYISEDWLDYNGNC